MSDLTVAMTPTVEEYSAELRFLRATYSEREALLAQDIFPGSASKAMTAIELCDGATIHAVFQRYEPACLKLWIPNEGIFRTPFQLLSQELQECFPQDSQVQFRRASAEVCRRLEEMQKLVEETLNDRGEDARNLAERITGLEREFLAIGAERDAKAAQVAELEEENEALRRELQELKSILNLEP